MDNLLSGVEEQRGCHVLALRQYGSLLPPPRWYIMGKCVMPLPNNTVALSSKVRAGGYLYRWSCLCEMLWLFACEGLTCEALGREDPL